ncbi:MAG: molybdate ABC transporter substrate-binding protein [Oscillospiraceae bacterium]
MKKHLALILCLAICLCLLAGCANKTDDPKQSEEPVSEPTELIVFAAASMQETLTELGDKYMAANENVKLTFNFDSSGTLKTQIQEGAECDIFISAGQKQVDQLDITSGDDKNPDKLDFILEGTRFDILENKVTLCVPADNPKNIKSFDDLKKGLEDGSILLAMGNSDVPVGQYTQKILTWLGLDEESLAAKGCITYGSNVKEVTTQISEGAVDCGIIYCTDAFSAGLTIVDYATKDMCGQVIYPAAIIKGTKNQQAAQDFLDFLCTQDSMAVFENVGFSAVK